MSEEDSARGSAECADVAGRATALIQHDGPVLGQPAPFLLEAGVGNIDGAGYSAAGVVFGWTDVNKKGLGGAFEELAGLAGPDQARLLLFGFVLAAAQGRGLILRKDAACGRAQ